MVGIDTAQLLITGVYGQLGRALATAAEARGIRTQGRDLDTLDIRDHGAVGRWITDASPRTVVNCAAFTDVDDCESHRDEAMATNGTAVGHLASACNAIGARLVQISTDYVFDGQSARPYCEDDPVGPVNQYGITKLRGEELARSATEHLIVRTAWIYGDGGRNFVDTIRSRIAGGATALRVVDDQHGCPTHAGDLAEAILDLIAAGADGVVHAVNSGRTTWHGLAVEIARILAAEVDIEPVSTQEYPRPAKRPAYSVLDTSRLVSIIGRPMAAWQNALNRHLEQP